MISCYLVLKVQPFGDLGLVFKNFICGFYPGGAAKLHVLVKCKVCSWKV